MCLAKKKKNTAKKKHKPKKLFNKFPPSAFIFAPTELRKPFPLNWRFLFTSVWLHQRKEAQESHQHIKTVFFEKVNSGTDLSTWPQKQPYPSFFFSLRSGQIPLVLTFVKVTRKPLFKGEASEVPFGQKLMQIQTKLFKKHFQVWLFCAMFFSWRKPGGQNCAVLTFSSVQKETALQRRGALRYLSTKKAETYQSIQQGCSGVYFLGCDPFFLLLKFLFLRIRKYYFKWKVFALGKKFQIGFFFIFWNLLTLKKESLGLFCWWRTCQEEEGKSSTSQQGRAGGSSFWWYCLASSSLWWCCVPPVLPLAPLSFGSWCVSFPHSFLWCCLGCSFFLWCWLPPPPPLDGACFPSLLVGVAEFSSGWCCIHPSFGWWWYSLVVKKKKNTKQATWCEVR